MAEFFWIGGATATSGSYSDGGLSAGSRWIRAFDWNNPLNWKSRPIVGMGGGLVTATRSPSKGDVVIFGRDANLVYGIGVSFAKTPCLFGGVTMSGITTTWRGGGTAATSYVVVGATAESGLENIRIESLSNPGYFYPFKYLGTGLVSSFLDSDFISDFTSKSGFTWDATKSWTELVSEITDSNNNPMGYGWSGAEYDRYEYFTIKTKNIGSYGDGSPGETSINKVGLSGLDYPSLDNHGQIKIRSLKNYITLTGVSGAYVHTNAALYGTAKYTLTGYATSVFRGVHESIYNQTTIKNLLSQNFISHRRNYLAFGEEFIINGDGCTVGTVDVQIDSMVLNNTSTYGSIVLNPKTTAHSFSIRGNSNKNAIWSEFGWANGGTADPNWTNLYLGHANINAGYTLPSTLDGMIVGWQTNEPVTANRIVVGSISQPEVLDNAGTTNTAKCYFNGDANINNIETYRGQIGSMNATSNTVRIGNLRMFNESILDLANSAATDNSWFFGTQNGNSIIGGINFEDDTCMMKGRPGIRVWNDIMVFSINGGGSKRQGKLNSPTTSVGSFT